MDEAQQSMGQYIIHSQKDNINHILKLLDPDTPVTNLLPFLQYEIWIFEACGQVAEVSWTYCIEKTISTAGPCIVYRNLDSYVLLLLNGCRLFCLTIQSCRTPFPTANNSKDGICAEYQEINHIWTTPILRLQIAQYPHWARDWIAPASHWSYLVV